VDSVVLGGYIEGGEFDFLAGAPGTNFELDNLLQVQSVVNNGEATNLTGASLQDAVNALFQTGGAFDAAGAAATEAAGLFNYGGDTYLIAAGGTAGGSFGTDDYIVKVTGVSGTLDISDFYQQMVG
jgi:hypothetical protein